MALKKKPSARPAAPRLVKAAAVGGGGGEGGGGRSSGAAAAPRLRAVCEMAARPRRGMTRWADGRRAPNAIRGARCGAGRGAEVCVGGWVGGWMGGVLVVRGWREGREGAC